MLETLDAIRQDIAERLRAAADGRDHPMHVCAVATAKADARMMVLRAFDDDRWTLRFHTDARAPKVAAIEADPAVGVLLWDSEDRVQIRIRGTGLIERTGARVDAAWDQADRYARRCYLGAAPGEERPGPDSGLPDWIEGEKPTEEQLAPVRGNFALLRISPQEIDWYALSHGGHRRALFRRGEKEFDKGRWITP